MAKRSNSPPKKQALFEVFSGVTDLLDAPGKWLEAVMYKWNHLAETNYAIGCDSAERGFVNDALFRFRMTVWIDPKHVQAHYNLACCYLTKGQIEKAVQHFIKALRISPEHEDAMFMLASLRPETIPADKRPKSMPLKLAVSYFDAQAAGYNEYLRSQNYNGHMVLQQHVKPLIKADRMDYTFVDLGCGTGWSGYQCREMAAKMIGVDISRQMLQQALKLKKDNGDAAFYDELIHNDLRHFLISSEKPRGDVIFAMDVMQFVGDLEVVFEGAAKALKPGGHFLFTFEPNKEGGYGLVKATGRFGHDKSYIEDQANRADLEVVSIEPVQLVQNQPCFLAVCKKPGE